MPHPLSEALAALPLFAPLDTERLDDIAGRSRRITLARGALLFTRGTPSTGFFGVITGSMQLSVNSPEGAAKVVEIIREGQSFGEAVMFLRQPYPVDATALAPTTLVAIPAQVVDDLLDSDPQCVRAMLASLSKRLHGLVSDVEMLSLRSAYQRVAAYLLGEVSAAGEGAAGVHLPSSQQVLASRLGMTPETFSRVLRELIEREVVTREGRDLLVSDPSALERYAQDPTGRL